MRYKISETTFKHTRQMVPNGSSDNSDLLEAHRYKVTNEVNSYKHRIEEYTGLEVIARLVKETELIESVDHKPPGMKRVQTQFKLELWATKDEHIQLKLLRGTDNLIDLYEQALSL